MKKFKCKLLDNKGKIISVIQNGNSIEEIEASFIGSNYIPLKIKQIAESKFYISAEIENQVLEFTQIMNQLISSGLSIKDSLEISNIIDESGKNKIAEKILLKINKGTSFAESINCMPETFSTIYRGIISIGDKIGTVEKIFPRLTSYLENRKKIKNTILNAMIYPIIVLATTIIGALALAVFIFPKLKMMFQEFGGETAKLLQNNIYKLKLSLIFFSVTLLLIILTIYILLIFSKSDKKTKLLIDSFVIKLPIIGKFIISLESLNFSFAMETMILGGITIENSLKESLNIITNTVYLSKLEEVSFDLVNGISLSEAFSKHKIFPSYMKKWMIVGEKSGNPEQIFSQIKNYFQNEVNSYTTKFMNLIEPILIILIGIFMLILVVTIVVPVFSLYGSII